MTPFFSIIIPTHSRPDGLVRAVASLRANTFQDFEIIVCMDVMDARTLHILDKILTDSDTFVKRSGSAGPAQSRNLGLSLAKGHSVVFLDDDDAFLPDFLENAYAATCNHPNTVAYTNYSIIQEDRNLSKILSEPQHISVAENEKTEVYVKNFIHNHTAIYPLHALRGHTQSPELRSLEDWDFLLGVFTTTEFRYVDINGPIIYKDYVNPGSRRGNSADASNTHVISDYLHIYKRWPAPTQALKIARQNLLTSAGLTLPLDWF